MKKSFKDFLWEKHTPLSEVVKADLSGKTVIVIGANTGIGLEATKHFATMNPSRIIIGCRNVEKGRAAIAEIVNKTGYEKTALWSIDLSKFSSVVDFADKFEEDGGRLDLLVANAAVAMGEYEATEDGWESSLQVNHLSTALLSLLLLPAMLRTAEEHSAKPRLVIVSSDVHYWTKIAEEAFESPKILEKYTDESYCTSGGMKGRYLLSKLLNVFFTRALNARLAPACPLTVSAVNPGYCYSELRRHFSFPWNLLDRLMELALARTSEEGSRQLIYAAIGGSEEDNMRGAYISNSKVIEVSDYVLSENGGEAQERIWTETVDVLSRVSPKIRVIVDEYLAG